jgi:hypothetical protein
MIVPKFVRDWRPPQGLHIVDRASTLWKKLTEKKECLRGVGGSFVVTRTSLAVTSFPSRK